MAKMDLGKAYIQIVPSMKGIKGAIENPIAGSGESAGSLFGSKFVGLVKKLVIAAGVGKVVKESVMAGSEYQQAAGGIRKIFAGADKEVIAKAQNAYSKAGMSASQYMQNMTMFGASLVSSLGGNTKKAAEVGNMAIEDMSDNANTFGTDIESIQYAYQGFSKQNYTMLDNLRLGYGGTKSEMQRLLSDATKLTGVKYDINNLSDVYNAIHAIQENLNITKTTSREAATTFEGSFNAMKASATNVLAAMSLGQDVTAPLKALVQTTTTFVMNNLLPMIGNILKSVPDLIITLVDTIGQQAPQLIQKGTDLIQNLATGLSNSAPKLLDKGMQLLDSIVSGFSNSIPTMLPKVLDFVQQMATNLAQQAPKLISKGFELLNKLADGIISAIPILIQKVPTIITTLANIINDNFPTILMKGAQLLIKLVMGIISAIPTLIMNIPKIITAIVSVLTAFSWLSLGGKIITFFKNGIVSMVPVVGKAGKGIFDAIINMLKNLPSNLLNLAKSAITFFKNIFTAAKGSLGGIARGIFTAIVNAIKALPGNLRSLGSNAIKSLGNAIKGLGGWIAGKAKSVGKGLIDGIKNSFSGIGVIGSNLIKGLWSGISNVTGWITSKIKGFGSSVISSIKGIFGIHSPSRVMRDEVGKFLGMGIGVGLTESVGDVVQGANAINGAIQSTLETNIPLNTSISSAEIGAVQKNLNLSMGNSKQDKYANLESKLDTLITLLVSQNEKGTDLKVYLDGDTLVGSISDKIDNQLYRNQKLKERGV